MYRQGHVPVRGHPATLGGQMRSSWQGGQDCRLSGRCPRRSVTSADRASAQHAAPAAPSIRPSGIRHQASGTVDGAGRAHANVGGENDTLSATKALRCVFGCRQLSCVAGPTGPSVAGPRFASEHSRQGFRRLSPHRPASLISAPTRSPACLRPACFKQTRE